MEEQITRRGALAPPHIVMEKEDVEKQLEEYERLLKEKSYEEAEKGFRELSERLSAAEKKVRLQFVNRANEVNLLSNPVSTHPVTIIDAPAGFGKTELLREARRKISERPDEKDWICEIIDFKEFGDSERTLLRELARRINYKRGEVLDELSEAEIILRVVGYLNRRSERNIVLLFDSAEENPDLIQWLNGTLAKEMNRVLFTKSWWMFIVGRYVREIFELRCPCISLTPFNRPVIEQMVDSIRRTYLDDADISPESFNYIVRVVNELSGGHPHCIIGIALDLANTYSFAGIPVPLSRERQKRLFKKHTLPIINNEIMSQIPEKLRETVEILSVFRGFNLDTITELIDRGFIEGYRSNQARRLFRDLMGTRLYNPSSIQYPLYSDRITRRLLEAKLRLLSGERYQEANGAALVIYETWIRTWVETQPVIVFFSEGLYHKSRDVQMKSDQDERWGSIREWVYAYLDVINRQTTGDFAETVSRIKKMIFWNEKYEDVRYLLEELIGKPGVDSLIEILDDKIEEAGGWV